MDLLIHDATVVTQDDSLVDKIQIKKDTGLMRSIY